MTAEAHINAFPNVFRILVIDDQICSDSACQKQVDKDSDSGHVKNLIRCYFTSVVQRVALGQKTKGIIKAELPAVEVDFAKDPDEGVVRWMESVYDLTLVDSDFSRDETMRQKIDERHKRNFLDLKLEFVGAYLYRFLHEMLSGKEFGNSRKRCRVALWTGLSLGEEKRVRTERLISILPRSKEGLCFIPKKEGDVGGWREKLGLDEKSPMTIEGLIDEMANDNPVLNPFTKFDDDTAKSYAIIGRIKGLYRVKPPEKFASLCGLGEQIYVGWLKEEGGGVDLCDERIDGGISLSPLLRRGEDVDDCVVKEGDNDEIQTRKKTNAERLKALSRTLLEIRKDDKGIVVPQQDGQQNKAHIVAAATPLTGCSAVNESNAIELLQRKIGALLEGPFGKVVLKTVYLDSLNQWDNLHWPTLQAQSHHRTRCLRSTAHPRTLWNTGITALESFTPEMMHEFLMKFAEKDVEKRKNTIVSLGSKFPQWNLNERIQQRNEEIKSRVANGDVKDKKLGIKHYRNHAYAFPECKADLKKDLEEIWTTLFNKVFSDELKGEDRYPIVEINVRHYLRECVAYHLGGHEYLSPAKIDPDREKDELDFTGCYQSLDLEFNAWLEVLDSIATDFGKKLLLKLPFRGDILHFIRLIRDYVKKHPGTSITGITLINAFKSGVVESAQGVEYSPAWYGRLDAWHDAAGRQWKYQMSGELLTASRNELLGEVLNLVAGADLDAHISGGIVDSEGLRYCSPIVVRADKCRKCGACNRPQCNKGAITVVPSETIATIDQNKCVACGKCIEKCKFGAIVRRPVQIGTWALMDLNLGKKQLLSCANVPPSIGNGRPTVTRCEKCEPCHVQCRHKAFVPSANGIAARIDGGKCVECKECLRMCPCGAITLGDNGTNTSGDAALCTSAILDKRINPRIAFCLHELCNGCGKCSRTFYCDTFMDRRGLDLPPMMDSRNCTGCGLCAQTCPRGAIQLFDPKHVAVLIGEKREVLTAWHRRLTAYEIPHLVYEKVEIEANYPPCKHDATSGNANSQPSEKDMFEWRIANDSFFDKTSDGYVDERKWDAAQAILKKVEPDSIFRKWLFLAWSDPGQVLKDSPVIYACTTDKCCYFQTSLGKVDCGLQWNDVLNHHSGMAEIKREVDKRLRNLREER